MKIRNRLVFMFLACSMVGCTTAGVQQYDEEGMAIYLSEMMIVKRTKTVLANVEAWRNSGVIVEKEKVYRINAQGKWCSGSNCKWTGADGKDAYSLWCWDNNRQIVEGWSHSALVAKIGEKGAPFGVGGEMVLKPEAEGILYFRIGDQIHKCGDNKGDMKVTVRLLESAN